MFVQYRNFDEDVPHVRWWRANGAVSRVGG